MSYDQMQLSALSEEEKLELATKESLLSTTPVFRFLRDLGQDDFKGDLGQGDSKVENVHTDKRPVCAGDTILKGWAFRPNGLCPQFNPNNIYLGRGESLSGSGIKASFNVLPNGEIHIWAWIYIPTATGGVGEEWKSGDLFMTDKKTKKPISDRMYTNGVLVSPSDEKATANFPRDGATHEENIYLKDVVKKLYDENKKLHLKITELALDSIRLNADNMILEKENEELKKLKSSLVAKDFQIAQMKESIGLLKQSGAHLQGEMVRELKNRDNVIARLVEENKALRERQTPVRVDVFRLSSN
jgi:hypothetical protein